MNLRHEIEQFTPAMRRLSQALVCERLETSIQTADDLVHETLLRALKFNEPVRGMPVLHWLYAILIGIHRQTQRKDFANQADEGNSTRQMGHGQSSFAGPGFKRTHQSRHFGASGVEANSISAALRSLDLEEREVLLLVGLEGLSYVDSAAILGLPQATLIARLARARAHLAQTTAKPSAAPFSHLRLIS